MNFSNDVRTFANALKKNDLSLATSVARTHLTSVEIKIILSGSYPDKFKREILSLFLQKTVKDATGYKDFAENSLDFLPELWKEVLKGKNYAKESLKELHEKIFWLAKQNKTRVFLDSLFDTFERYHPLLENEKSPADLGIRKKDLTHMIKPEKYLYLSLLFQEEENKILSM